MLSESPAMSADHLRFRAADTGRRALNGITGIPRNGSTNTMPATKASSDKYERFLDDMELEFGPGIVDRLKSKFVSVSTASGAPVISPVSSASYIHVAGRVDHSVMTRRDVQLAPASSLINNTPREPVSRMLSTSNGILQQSKLLANDNIIIIERSPHHPGQGPPRVQCPPGHNSRLAAQLVNNSECIEGLVSHYKAIFEKDEPAASRRKRSPPQDTPSPPLPMTVPPRPPPAKLTPPTPPPRPLRRALLESAKKPSGEVENARKPSAEGAKGEGPLDGVSAVRATSVIETVSVNGVLAKNDVVVVEKCQEDVVDGVKGSLPVLSRISPPVVIVQSVLHNAHEYPAKKPAEPVQIRPPPPVAPRPPQLKANFVAPPLDTSKHMPPKAVTMLNRPISPVRKMDPPAPPLPLSSPPNPPVEPPAPLKPSNEAPRLLHDSPDVKRALHDSPEAKRPMETSSKAPVPGDPPAPLKASNEAKRAFHDSPDAKRAFNDSPETKRAPHDSPDAKRLIEIPAKAESRPEKVAKMSPPEKRENGPVKADKRENGPKQLEKRENGIAKVEKRENIAKVEKRENGVVKRGEKGTEEKENTTPARLGLRKTTNYGMTTIIDTRSRPIEPVQSALKIDDPALLTSLKDLGSPGKSGSSGRSPDDLSYELSLETVRLEVIGHNVPTGGKSSLRSRQVKHLRIQFNDQATITHEYPSERSLVTTVTAVRGACLQLSLEDGETDTDAGVEEEETETDAEAQVPSREGELLKRATALTSYKAGAEKPFALGMERPTFLAEPAAGLEAVPEVRSPPRAPQWLAHSSSEDGSFSRTTGVADDLLF